MSLTRSGEFDDVNNDSYISGQITVGTSAVLANVSGTNLEGRETLRIYNKSNTTIYFGATGVTVSTGEPIYKNQWIELSVGDNIDIYLITDSAGNDIVVHEFS